MFNEKTFDILRPTTTAGDKTAYVDTTRDIVGYLTPTENAYSALGVGGFAKSWTLFCKNTSADVKEGDRLKVSATEEYEVRGVQIYNHAPKHLEIMVEEVIKQGGAGSSEEEEEYDADAQILFDEMEEEGDILTDSQKNAINTFVITLKALGLWIKCIAIYLTVGGTATAHKWNLKSPGSYNATFTGSPTHSAFGIQFNGVNQWADTGINDNITLQDDTARDFYSRTNSHGNELDMGVYGGGSSYFLVSYGGAFYVALHNAQLAIGATPFADTRGLFSQQRINNNTVETYRNGILVHSTSIAPSIAPINGNIWFGGCNPSFFSAKQFSYAAVRTKFTSQEMLDYYNAIQTLQTALGRAV